LQCDTCGFLREIPKRMAERPDLCIVFKERAEASHVRHKQNHVAGRVRGLTAYQVAQFVLGGI